MKTLLLLLSFSAVCLYAVPKEPETLPFDDAYLFGLLHHLCYWHLDDYSYYKYDRNDTVEILYKRLTPPTDPGDESTFCEIVIPDLDMAVMLKKALYTIEELGMTVSNKSYKITTFHREIDLASNPKYKEYPKKIIPEKELFDYIFNKRANLPELDPYVISKLKEVLPEIVASELPTNMVLDESFYIAPVTPYANLIAIFWENAKKMIILTSDAELHNPVFWEELPLNTEIFDMKSDVVTSLRQVLGSNAYVTKNWIGRILFNCIIDGYKLELKAPPKKIPSA